MNSRVLNSSNLVLAVLLCGYPFVFERFLPIPNIYIIYFLLLINISITLFNKRTIFKLPKGIATVFIVQIIAWLFYSVIHIDTSYITRVFLLIVTYLVLIYLYNTNQITDFFKKFNKILLLQVVLGTFAFFLILANILNPLFEFTNVDQRTCYCFGLTCSNALFGNIIRVGGFFDEPGAFAFWGIWALIINKLFIKNKFAEIIIIIGLAFTFSISYYIQVILYLVLFYHNNPKVIITIAVFVIVASAIIITTKGTDFDIYKLTFQRFEKNYYGDFAGNNREPLMVEAKKYFYNNMIFGYGARNIENLNIYIADNPFETLAQDGILGTIITYLPLLWILLKNIRKKEIVYSIIVLVIGYFQRPFHLNLIHYLILYGFFMLIHFNKIRVANNYNKVIVDK